MRSTLEWREQFGPKVKVRRKKGFGSMVIERNLASALDAKVDLKFDPDGLRCSHRDSGEPDSRRALSAAAVARPMELFAAADVVGKYQSKWEFDMHKPLSALAALAVVAAVALPAPSMAQGRERTKVGTLTCDISAGIGLIITSKKELTCMFTPSQPGPREVYTGSITKFGLDLGATAGGEMVWAVYAPTTRQFGALAGHYGGASAEATVGAGRRRQRPGRRLEPHRDLAAGIGAGAGRPQCGGRRRRT